MVDIKELTKQKCKICSGHRMCPGCGAAINARMFLMGTDKPIVVATATGCIEVSTTVYPFTAWNVPWIHNAFENVAATISGVEAAYNVLKKKGKVKEDIKFIAFGGDGGTYDIGLQALSGAAERGHDFLYVCYNNEAYMNCLSLDTLIMTEDGLKKIIDIKINEKIYAFDQKNHKIVLKKCTRIFDNGIKKVFKLETLHHSIKATSNHPFLVLKRNGKGKKSVFVWKTLIKLKRGEEIVVLKKILNEKSYKFKPIKISKKGDYKVNKINNMKMPKKSSSELMELLGLYVGDGWVRVKKAETGFALPQNAKGSKRLIQIYKKLFRKELIQKEKNYIYIYSINFAKFIDSLGFGNGAKNKIIPHWVFTLPKNEKEAFIKGLMLSDGYNLGKSNRYVSASYDLLKSLRLLLQTMNYRVGKIHQQTKKKGTFVVYRKLLEDSTYGYICFSKKTEPNIKKYSSQIKQRDFFIDNEHFSTEKITSIKFVKKEPTLDLRVEKEHNFIADGIVVHNTGIQRSSATPFGAATKTDPCGEKRAGKQEFSKDLTRIMVAHNIPYVAQTSISHWNDLIEKTKKAFEIKGPKFINSLSPCIPGWGIKENESLKVARLAVETCFWPLYEVENGRYKITYDPGEGKKPVIEFLKMQKRFAHLQNTKYKDIVKQIQEHIDKNWENLKKLEKL